MHHFNYSLSAKYLVAGLLLLATRGTAAQEAGLRRIENRFGFGTTYRTMSDPAAAGSALRGQTFLAGYERVIRSQNRYTQMDIIPEWGSMSGKDQEGQMKSLSVRLLDGFILNKNSRGQLQAALGYGIALQPAYLISKGGQQGSFSWSSINHFSLFQANRFQFRRHLLFTQLVLPVAGLLYRPHQPQSSRDGNHLSKVLYAIYQNAQPVSWDVYKSIEAVVGLEFSVTRETAIGVQYRYTYRKAKVQDPFEEKGQAVRVGIRL